MVMLVINVWYGKGAEKIIFKCVSHLSYPFLDLTWLQMSSGENLDPRVVEAVLDQSPSIFRSCVVGNNFLRTSSQLVCAIIEPAKNSPLSREARLADITRAISSANRSLAPPLRISWSRVLILDDGHAIPITKKGAIFRKKLEELFGQQISALLYRSQEETAPQTEIEPAASLNRANGRTKDQIGRIVADIVFQTLRISAETLENNTDATFAEVSVSSFFESVLVIKYCTLARNGLRNVHVNRQ